MKHPVWDRILILLCALIALGCAAGVVALLIGKISFDMITGWIASVDMSRFVVKAAMAGIAALFVLLFLLLFAMILPSRKKRSSNYAIQRNENGMVRISLKALETLVNKCLNQHAELKVVTSSLYSDEESIRVDVHISLPIGYQHAFGDFRAAKADQEVSGSLLRRDGAGSARLCG